MENIIMLILGVFISVMGIVNIKGNISTIHSYNRRKVKEEDIPTYGKTVGTGTLLSSVLAHTMIYSPWVIYFSIIATQWLVRFIKMKRKSDLVLTVLFFVLSILAFVGFVSHLLEVRI